MIDSGATSHMTGSKNIVVDLEPSHSTVSYGDNTCSKVLGLGKVVVTPDISLVNVLLVETLGYNLLSVHQIARMGLCTFFDEHMVVLLWSKTLRVAFVGYVESGCMLLTSPERQHLPLFAYSLKVKRVGYGIAD